MLLNLILNYLILCESFVQLVRGQIFEECEGVDTGTFVASWESCQTYIYCDGADSAAGECDEGQYFDNEVKACDDKENVQCVLDEIVKEEQEEIVKEEEADEEPELEPEVLESTDFEEAFEEEEKPPTMEVTTLSSSTSTASEADSINIGVFNVPPIIKDVCPASDDPNQIILMASVKSCSDYYLCYHGHAMLMHCSNQLHFNANTGQCDFPENVQCAMRRPNANKCLPHVTDFFPHPDRCNYFYYCIKGFLTVQQCPFYYGWDIERRSCVQISQAKCFGNAKRT